MIDFLEITDKDIADLNDIEFRSLIGLLCEAEYRKHGISSKSVQWGGHQDAPDGGIDILITSQNLLPPDSYIIRPHTVFQSKVTNMTPALIRKEMKPEGTLRTSILELSKGNGAYIIVSSHSITSKEYNIRIGEMAKAVEGLNVHIEYYHGGRIASWVREYSSIALWVRQRIKRPIMGWKSYHDWIEDISENDSYILDDSCKIIDKRTKNETPLTIENGMSVIKELLALPGNYLRLTGLSGVGKTRLAQALFDEKIGPQVLNNSLVLYTDISYEPIPSPQHIVDQLIAGKYPAILIIDNCSPDLHRQLVASLLRAKSHLVSLLTIEYDIAEDQPDETQVFHIEPSSDNVITELILRHFPKTDKLGAMKIAEFSGGNARIALALARILVPGEPIGHLQDRYLFKRLFDQRNSENESLERSAEVLSLVYSYDGESVSEESSELKILAMMSSVPATILYKHTVDLKDRGLVQTRGKFRAVLPHAIANRLAIGALERIPIETIEKYLLREENMRLIRSFCRRLSYIPDKQPVERIVEKWLSPESGWMNDVSNLSEFGISVFELLSAVLPEHALAAIERANTLLPDKFASRENEHFPRFVRLLKHIGFEKSLFIRAINIMGAFALTEKFGENRDPIRKELSTMYQALMSGTHAPIEMRLEFITQLWETNLVNKQQLAIELIKSSLKTSNFQSSFNSTFGSISRDNGLYPQNPDEIENWYTKAVEQCIRMLNDDSSFKPELKKILADKLRGIWTKAGLFDLVESVCEKITRNGFWEEGWFSILQIIEFLEKDEDASIRQRLLILEESMRPRNLLEKITAYFQAEMGEYNFAYTLLGKNGNKFDKVFESFENLGAELAKDEQTLGELTSLLFLKNNNDIFHLGRGLYDAIIDKEKIWNYLIDMYLTFPVENRKPFLLKGWVWSANKKEEKYSDQILEYVQNEEALKHLFIPLQSSISISVKGVNLIKKALDDFDIPSKEFRSLSHALVNSNLTQTVLTDIIRGMLNRPNGHEVAFEVLYYKCYNVKIGGVNDLSDALLDIGRQLLLSLNVEKDIDSQDDHDVSVVVEICFAGDVSFYSAQKFASRLMILVRSGYGFRTEFVNIVESLAKVQPICLLNTLLEKGTADPHIGWVDFNRNFEKYEPHISTLPDELLVNWCEEDPNQRYELMAGAIICYKGDDETGQLNWKPIFWKLMGGAPDLLRFLNAVEDTLRPTFIQGSRARTYQSRLTLFSALFDSPNSELSKWARLKYRDLNVEIASSKKIEEERDQRRNERFE